jgi:hypothetical protein
MLPTRHIFCFAERVRIVQEFKAGDVIFREAPLLAVQHSSSRAQSLVCDRCFRYLGSIEDQLIHRLLMHDQPHGERQTVLSNCSSKQANGGQPIATSQCSSKQGRCSKLLEASSRNTRPVKVAVTADTDNPTSGDSPHSDQITTGDCHESHTTTPIGSNMLRFENVEASSEPQTTELISHGGDQDSEEHFSANVGHGTCSEDTPPDDTALRSVQQQLRQFAAGTERLPLSKEFPLPSPVQGRYSNMPRAAEGCGADGGGIVAATFCSTSCEQMAWESYNCIFHTATHGGSSRSACNADVSCSSEHGHSKQWCVWCRGPVSKQPRLVFKALFIGGWPLEGLWQYQLAQHWD